MRYQSIEAMLLSTAAAIRPPERLSVSEAAEKYRIVNNPGSYVGPWMNSTAPYLVEIMDMLQSTDVTAVIFAGPARCGKSDIFFNWLEYTAICDPADMMVVHMKQATARDWSIGDLRKTFRSNPALNDCVVPGRQNMNVHDIHFMSGMRLLVKWPTITELSGKTVPRVWFMDYDRMDNDVDQEGPPFDLGRKRTQTFGRYGMTVAEASPGYEVEKAGWRGETPHEAPPTKGILSLYNRGDRRRLYWFCASCSEPFEPDFKHLDYPDLDDHMSAAAQATMACPMCGFKHTHEAGPGQPGKHGLNQKARWVPDGMTIMPDGELVGTPARSDIASFWLKGPAAAFATWQELVFKFLKAMEAYEKTGDAGALKATINLDQGLPYTPIALSGDLLPEMLEDRADPMTEHGFVAPDIRFLIASIDVQKNHFVVQVMGVKPDGDVVIVDRFSIKQSRRRSDDDSSQFLWVNPATYLEDWKILIEEVIEKTYELDDGTGRHMMIKAIACDSGGKEGVTVKAYEFWRYLRDEHEGDHHARFQLVKGASNKEAPRVRITYPDAERQDRKAAARGQVPVMMINTNMLKDMVYAMLMRTEPGGGMVTYPNWLPSWFYSELVAENRTAKGWEKPSSSTRNEAFDLMVYAMAIALHQRFGNLENIDWAEPPIWAEGWDENSMVFSPSDEARPYESKAPSYDLAALGEGLG
ncbi:terminase large subunit [Loktanella phage pCB2051-A]|uniref:Terminase, large subunit n=1 Tax=Loktanella phage pCB2051-A TaxID=754044 RepID=M4QRH8_9CAUD|nr:terminase large subunit [Loktanella phage pCB2051-A]AGH31458.1 terminase large subunit [Loktanella phage pCB2051-A]